MTTVHAERGDQMRLIDADAWDVDLMTYGIGQAIIGRKIKYTVGEVRSALAKRPTVDAEPVRHGRWMKNGDRYCECSVCHHEGNMSGQDSYCWNCGAKMDAPTQKSVDNALEALDEVEE